MNQTASDSRAAQYVNAAVYVARTLLIEEGSDDAKVCMRV